MYDITIVETGFSWGGCENRVDVLNFVMDAVYTIPLIALRKCLRERR